QSPRAEGFILGPWAFAGVIDRACFGCVADRVLSIGLCLAPAAVGTARSTRVAARVSALGSWSTCPNRIARRSQIMAMNRRTFLAAGTAIGALAAKPQALAQWQPSQRYPDPLIKIIDPSFAKYRVTLAKVERIATGMRWCEGPVWFGDGRYLLWSDIPNNRIMRWDEETGAVSVFRKPANNANGNTRDRQGRLITCEH